MTILTNPVEHKNKLLKDYKDGVLTYERFIASCVVWLQEPSLWKDIIVKYEPPPPQIKEWQDYETMSKYEKAKIGESFYNIPEIAHYISLKNHALRWNIGMYGWLKEQKEIIPDIAENLDIHKKLDMKIYEFRDWIRRFAPKHISFKESQERHEYVGQPEEVGEVAKAALDTFGGQVT
ncbi:MAG: hypothetical protein PHQ22_10325 [Sulfuricurvum sp.]|nr:hypothetical protein [Sulfuricurvum sp.]